MKGFVQTPNEIVDLMVEKLFHQSIPCQNDVILDPGCGKGAFIEGIIRWCNKNSISLPNVIGIESDPRHILEARQKFEKYSNIEIRHEDFLTTFQETYDYIIGNPPYVPITKLSEDEKSLYRELFKCAKGRFDLYLLFYEQALRCLKPEGRLVFITPEKYLYVDSASPFRFLLNKRYVEEIHMLDEQTFGELTTYPTITTIVYQKPKASTKVILRNKKTAVVKLPNDGKSWLPTIFDMSRAEKGTTLKDISRRVSCGVATGADSIFVKRTKELDSKLLEFAYPTISGRQLTSTGEEFKLQDSMLVPYSKNGKLVSEHKLDSLIEYLSIPKNFDKLVSRTCVKRKPWYSFHENPPLSEILKPKILCKDIAAKPHFWIDKEGSIVPRHSVYYIVPKDPNQIEPLCEYLNSEEVCEWLEAHCQRAANGFIRLQSKVLKLVPIPESFYLNRGIQSLNSKKEIIEPSSNDLLVGDQKC